MRPIRACALQRSAPPRSSSRGTGLLASSALSISPRPLGKGEEGETGNSRAMACAGRAAPACKPVRALQRRVELRKVLSQSASGELLHRREEIFVVAARA